jgi:hypothetical protein
VTRSSGFEIAEHPPINWHHSVSKPCPDIRTIRFVDIPEPSIARTVSLRGCPAIDSHRWMLMCHVDMQLVVARNLEEDHLAVVRERTIRRQSSDGGLHRRDVGRPRVGA